MIQSNNQLERWWRFLELVSSQMMTLRNHYETMANVGVTIQTALLAGILTWNIPCSFSLRIVASFVGMFWLLIHVFVRLHLRKHRREVLHYNALYSMLQKWANVPPNSIAPISPQ